MSLLAAAKSRLGRRPAAIDDATRERRWREANSRRALDDASMLSGALEGIASELRERGIAIRRFEDVFGSKELFDEAAVEVQRLYAGHRAQPIAQSVEKPFLTQLFKGPIAVDDVWGRIALHPDVLSVANAYLGMRSMLRSVQVWLTEPTSGPAVETQLWHRDGDDVMNVKVFVYFTDVGRGSGPFTYAPRTHPLGPLRTMPEHVNTRSTDEQMAAVVPADDWVVCTASASTVVFADTCGYHKQLKPESDERLLLMIQYTSGTPSYPRNFEIRGDAESLAQDQRYAVLERPA